MNNLPFVFYDEIQVQKSELPIEESTVEPTDTAPSEASVVVEPATNDQPTAEPIVDTEPATEPAHPYEFYYDGPEDQMTIKQKLQQKLHQHRIPDVTVETLGYHKDSEYIDTQYDVISTKTGFVQLIVHVMREEIRFQLPKHLRPEPTTATKRSKKKVTHQQTPLEVVARELQAELGYAWSNWF